MASGRITGFAVRSMPRSISTAPNLLRRSRWSGNIPSGNRRRRKPPLVLHVFSRPHLRAQNPDSDRIVTFTLLNNRTAQHSGRAMKNVSFSAVLRSPPRRTRHVFLNTLTASAPRWTTKSNRCGCFFASEDIRCRPWMCSRLGWRDRGRRLADPHGVTAVLRDQADRADANRGTRSFDARPLSTPGRNRSRLPPPRRRVSRRWIGEREQEIVHLPKEHQDAARRHLRGCREALERMRGGIALLETDDS